MVLSFVLEIPDKLVCPKLSLGFGYQGSEDFPKAISAYMQAREMGMDDYTVNLNIGTCHFMLNDFQNSIRYSEYALALKPGDPVAEYNIARSLLEQGDISRSIALFKQCTLPSAGHARLFALDQKDTADGTDPYLAGPETKIKIQGGRLIQW